MANALSVAEPNIKVSVDGKVKTYSSIEAAKTDTQKRIARAWRMSGVEPYVMIQLASLMTQ